MKNYDKGNNERGLHPCGCGYHKAGYVSMCSRHHKKMEIAHEMNKRYRPPYVKRKYGVL